MPGLKVLISMLLGLLIGFKHPVSTGFFGGPINEI
jgi:hypothetical protein